ncbi:hypothetical protein H9Q70_001491 [Fusarium xylarioides]|nr:hypothetical protein H9Q70_001491 [Fusarium xylarioides]
MDDRPDPNSYTVGWICAVTTEIVAAKAVLDKEHLKPDTLPLNDNNTYTFGEIGGHNIVIATLPIWQYGIANAARVAGDLVRSFPSIKIGLLVGIGGGVPTIEDIRLGDIVVGVPGYANSGVFQYDYGHTVQGMEFSVTGTLNQAPMCCLTAVNDLAAEHMLRGNTIGSGIQKKIQEYPNLSQNFGQPDPSTDRLFESNYVHCQDRASCDVSCDHSKAVIRPDRVSAAGPLVHFGLIASANTLMKDAIIRDKLSSQRDVLCFEMEAAGLSNHFPCLVIRGICDYADSHKNNKWQGYAALGAAVYAKQLLLQIIPIKGPINEINNGVKTLNLRNDEGLRNKVLNWLSKDDFTLRHRDIVEQRLAGTGQWFLESDEFKSWVREDHTTLFCTGSPGVGKTFISSMAIDQIQNLADQSPNVCLAYVYFDYKRDDQQPTTVLSSLIKQLACYQATFPGRIKDLYDRCRNFQRPPSFTELAESFRSVVDTYSKVYIIIDALDEFEGSYNVLITSRPSCELGTQRVWGKDLSLEILAKDRDVESYIHWRISREKELEIDNILRGEIVEKIQQSADQMFLLAVGQLDQLLSQPTIGDLKLTMQSLHRGVEGLKDRYTQQLRSLKRLMFARNPLSCLELRHAVAVSTQTRSIDKDYIPSLAIMQSLCDGFVVFGTACEKPRLVHLTLHEFLVQNLEKWFPDPMRYLLQTCLTYLGFDCFSTGPCGSWQGYEKRKHENPFYEYAARNWGYYTAETCYDKLDRFKLLQHRSTLISSFQALRFKKPNSPDTHDRFSKDTSKIHLAAYFGITQLAQGLLRRRGRLNRQNSLGQTPLWYAAEQGHESLVSLLLGFKGIDVNISGIGGTPLDIAVCKGHKAVAKLLLDAPGSDPCYDSLFLSASKEGHAEIVKLLLDTGLVDVNYDEEDTPLICAAQRGHARVVEHILATKQADIDELDSRGDSAYTWAVRYNHVDVVKLLLREPGIDFNRWIYGHSPLSQAANDNNEELFFVLLNSGLVDPEGECDGVETCLISAAGNGNMRIVQELVEKVKVDVNAVEEDMGRTAFLTAIDSGHYDVVKYLLNSPESWNSEG